MGVLWFMAGAASCFAALYFLAIHRKRNTLEAFIAMDIQAGKTALLTVVVKDDGGNIIPGASVVFSPISETGSGTEVLTLGYDSTKGSILIGPVGDAGNLSATATMPDGTVLTTPEWDFVSVGGVAVSAEIVAEIQ